MQSPLRQQLLLETSGQATKNVQQLQISVQFSSVQSLSCVRLFVTPWITAHQASLSITNSRSSNSHPSSQWCHPAISSSVVPFPSCPQSLPASGSFPMSQLLASGGQSIRTSASALVLPMNIQGWFPLGLTGLFSLLSTGLLGDIFFCISEVVGISPNNLDSNL